MKKIEDIFYNGKILIFIDPEGNETEIKPGVILEIGDITYLVLQIIVTVGDVVKIKMKKYVNEKFIETIEAPLEDFIKIYEWS